MTELFESSEVDAVFSPCRRYRYELWRRWASGGRYMMVIGLNPSTADERTNDPTIRRCIDFAKRLGYDGLCMTNLFAFRATDPAVMKAQKEPFGADNEFHVRKCAKAAGIIIAAWGVHGVHGNQDLNVKRWIEQMGLKLHCLGTTKDGHPSHPLYLPSTRTPIPF